MRVLRVIARLNVGGPARHVTILDRGLRLRGFETLLAHGDVGSGEASLEGLIAAAGIPAARVPGLGRRVSLFSDARAFASLLRLVFRLQPDVLHTHTAKAGTLGRAAAFLYNAARPRSRRCLVVHTFHGHVLHGYFGRLGSLTVRAIERMLGRITDCVFVLSPRQRQDIGERYRIAPAGRIHIVPLGLDLDPLLALSAREPRNPVVFGFVGRFVPIKDLLLLVEAFARVYREEPGTRLLLAGDGELRARVQAGLPAAGIGDAVTFAGWCEDLPALYAAMDVLVLSSRNEGTPVAVIEGMAAGLPVVATAVGGVPDVVTHGATGILVESGSADQMAAAMLRLARDPEERRRLGLAGREVARARFGAERLVADVAETYRAELLAKRSGRRAPQPVEQ